VYDIVRLLSSHRASVKKTESGWQRMYAFQDLDLQEFSK
jgi:hypothetical protein